jgi:hypothetical protein
VAVEGNGGDALTTSARESRIVESLLGAAVMKSTWKLMAPKINKKEKKKRSLITMLLAAFLAIHSTL